MRQALFYLTLGFASEGTGLKQLSSFPKKSDPELIVSDFQA